MGSKLQKAHRSGIRVGRTRQMIDDGYSLEEIYDKLN